MSESSAKYFHLENYNENELVKLFFKKIFPIKNIN